MQLLDRNTALAQGLKRFIGRPCTKHGPGAMRYAVDGKCCTCTAERRAKAKPSFQVSPLLKQQHEAEAPERRKELGPPKRFQMSNVLGHYNGSTEQTINSRHRDFVMRQAAERLLAVITKALPHDPFPRET